MDFIEKQWEAWRASGKADSVPKITDDELKEALIQDLSQVSKMTVGEYTLFQKWLEIKEKFPAQERNTVFGKEIIMDDPRQARRVREVKYNIWRPESVEDYLNLEPTLVYTDDSEIVENVNFAGEKIASKTDRSKELPESWGILRTFLSTMKNNSNIGRNLHFLVVDKRTEKYLGVICISGDFLDLTPRDSYIGWDRELKTQGHMINYTAIGSTIVPVQPLGYNYVGGKLLALLCLSDTVQNLWREKYDNVLVGVTTTSLYGKAKAGGMSQYDNLKHWKKMGYSSGSVSYEATRKTRKMVEHWLMQNYPRKYFEWYEAKRENGQPYKRDHRNRSYTFTYNKLNIPKDLIRSEHHRGIYFSPLYNNTCEFLRGEIQEKDLIKSFDTSEEYFSNLWKEKYAKKRINSLIKNDRVSDETLFYDDIIYMTWEETKEKYLTQVGR